MHGGWLDFRGGGSTVDGIVIFGGGLFFIATSVVGVRLLVLSRARPSQPETLLGLAFLVGGTLGGSVGQYVFVAAGSHPPEVMGLIVFTYAVASVLGIALYNAFTWRVFRAGEPWAAALVGMILCCGIGIIAWLGATGAFETGVQQRSQRLALTLASAIGPIWATVEGLRYHRVMKKRLALGLADPVVTNRFLLWGLGSLCASLIVLSAIAPTLLDASHPLARLGLYSIGILGTCIKEAPEVAARRRHRSPTGSG